MKVEQVRYLVDAGKITQAVIKQGAGGFEVFFILDGNEVQLLTFRGERRVCSKVDAAVGAVKSTGVKQITIRVV